MHDELWSNSANWTGGMLYACKRDPRLIVPKRRRAFGWTIMIALVAVPVVAAVASLSDQR